MALKYACSALVGTNKKGVLKPDDNGYYRMCVGAFNIYSSAGIWYGYEASKHLLDNSSSFIRRIYNGNLYSEEDHPQWPIGGKFEDYVARIKRIEPKNICAHLRDIEVVPGDTGPDGTQIMLVYASVKPDRERGHLLKAALDNPDQNVCFSIRALCDDKYVRGRIERTLTDIITFDWVVEPGIVKAHKYNSPALESFVDVEIPVAAIENLISMTKAGNGLGMESADIEGLQEIVDRYQSPGVSLKRPAALSW